MDPSESAPNNYGEKQQNDLQRNRSAHTSDRYYHKSSSSKDGTKSNKAKSVKNPLLNPLLMESHSDERKSVDRDGKRNNSDYVINQSDALQNKQSNNVQLDDRMYSFQNQSENKGGRLDYGINTSRRSEGSSNVPARYQSPSTSDYIQDRNQNRSYKSDTTPRLSRDYDDTRTFKQDSYQSYRNRKSSEYNSYQDRRRSNYGKDNSTLDDSYGSTVKNELQSEYETTPNSAYKKTAFVRRANVDYDFSLERLEGIPNKIIFDSHCHLDRIFDQWNKDKVGLAPDKWRGKDNPPDCKPIDHLSSQEQFKNAFGNKFEGCISVCCDPPTWTKAWYEWLTQEDNIWLTYGCHPAKAALFDESAEHTLQILLNFPRVTALGEIGLDDTYYERNGATKEVQIDAFKRQIEIARRMKKSLVIHLRGEVQDLAKEILASSGLPSETKIHMHCFNQSLDVAMEWLEYWPNMKFGVVPNFYDREVGRHLQLKHLLLETDAPYFVPKKLKECDDPPKMGVPGNVFHTACQISALREIPIEEILEANRRNIAEVYSIPCVHGPIESEQTEIKVEKNEEGHKDNNSEEIAKIPKESTVKIEGTEENDMQDMSNSIGDVSGVVQEKFVHPLPMKEEKRLREDDDYESIIQAYFVNTKKPKLETAYLISESHSDFVPKESVWKEVSVKVKEYVCDQIIASLFEEPSVTKKATYVAREPKPNYTKDAKELIHMLQTNYLQQNSSNVHDSKVKQDCRYNNENQAGPSNSTINPAIKKENIASVSLESKLKKETSTEPREKTSTRKSEDFKIPKVQSNPGKFMIPKKIQVKESTSDCSKPQNSISESEKIKKNKDKDKQKKEKQEFEQWLEKKKKKPDSKKDYTPMEVLELFEKWKRKHGKRERSHEDEGSGNGDKGGKHLNDKSSKHHRHDESKSKLKRHDEQHDHHKSKNKMDLNDKDISSKYRNASKEKIKFK